MGARLCALALTASLLALSGCGGGGGSEQSTKAQAKGSPQSQSQGGEASIEGFGQEAEGAKRQAILSAFTAYLRAISQKGYASACAQMAARLHEALAQLAKAKADCAQLLPALLSPQAPRTAKAQLGGTVTLVRARGKSGFVVFKAPGAKLYEMPMAEEGGAWKVANATAGVLVPGL